MVEQDKVSTNNEDKKEKVNKVRDIIINIITAIMCLLSVFLVVVSVSSKSSNGVPTINNRSYLYVQSESMTGIINKGDLIVVEKLDFVYNNNSDSFEPSKKLEENESVISFFLDINGDGKKEIVTHRFIKTEEQGTYYVCQGTYSKDGAPLAYQKIYYKQVIGVWTGKRVPVLGSIYEFLLDTPYAWGFGVVVIAPMFIIFLVKGYQLIATIIETRNENAKERAKLSDEEYERQKALMKEQILKELKEEQEKAKE